MNLFPSFIWIVERIPSFRVGEPSPFFSLVCSLEGIGFFKIRETFCFLLGLFLNHFWPVIKSGNVFLEIHGEAMQK